METESSEAARSSNAPSGGSSDDRLLAAAFVATTAAAWRWDVGSKTLIPLHLPAWMIAAVGNKPISLTDWEALIPDDDRARIRQARDAAVLSGEAWELEYRLQHAGDETWIRERSEASKPTEPFRLLVMTDATREKRALAFAQEQREKFSVLTANSNVGILQLTIDWYIVDANAAFLKFLEVDSIEQLRKIPSHEFVSPAHRERLMEQRAKRIRGEASVYDIELIGRRGTHRHALVSAVPLMHEGKLTGTVATYTDITELKRTENLLHAAAERYRAVIAALGEGITVIGQDGLLMDMNPAMVQLFGMNTQESTNLFRLSDAWKVYDEEGRLLRGEEMPGGRTLLTGKRFRNVPLRCVAKEGGEIWISVNSEPLFQPGSDRPEAAVVTLTDITELKLANLSLQAREASLTAVLNAFPDSLFIFSTEGVIVDYRCSHPTEPLGKPSEVLNHHMDQVFPPAIASEVHKQFEEVRRTGARQTWEFTAKLRDGIERALEARAMQLDDRRILMVVRDVSEAREAEQRDRQQRRQLAHMARLGALGEMTAGLSHEINQPLYAVMNFADASLNVLKAGGDAKQAMGWLADINKQVHRAAEIVKRYRRFAANTTQKSIVSVDEILRETAAFLEPEMRRHAAAIQLPAIPLAVRISADPIQMQQVLVNLISNAAEAVDGLAADRRRILVDAKIVDDKVRFSVIDRGRGLGDITPESLFEPFFTTKSHGLGLGLPICRGIVESHNGRLWAENNPAGGTCFYFEIPRDSSDL